MAQASPTRLISDWHHLFEGLQVSPLAFYERVERALAPYEIPQARTEHVDYREAGASSAHREYLRITRARNAVDICGAPFGNGFFVSWWLAEVRPPALVPTLVALLAMGIIARACITFGGIFLAVFAWVVIFLGLGLLMGQGEEPWHAYLLTIPVLGRLWEWLFLPPTYYRIDTALMFQEAVHRAVQNVIEEMSKAQGLRILTPIERRPILREFTGR